MKQFLSINDATNPAELAASGLSLKKDPFAFQHLGKNKTIGLLFFNPSLRTRLSTQIAAQNLGMNVIVMNIGKDGWQIEFEDGAIMDQGSQEHIKEAAGVVSQYCDIIGVRTFASLTDRDADYEEKILSKFVSNALVPVVSLESATLHPLQSLADWITIDEYKKVTKPKVVLTWAPHPKALPQAVGNSFAQWMSQADVELVVTQPEGFELDEQFTKGAIVTTDQKSAFEGADFIYAKNWSSFKNYGATTENHKGWTVDSKKMALTNNAKFMHCLPVRRNVVVTDSVIDSDASLVLEQANNRTFAAQAVIKSMLEWIS